jgi:hypothetical protein
LFNLSGITSTSAFVDQKKQPMLDQGQKASLLPVLPKGKLRRIRYVEAIEKRGDCQ